MKQPLLFTLLGVLLRLLRPDQSCAQATSVLTNGLIAQYSFDKSRGITAQEATRQLTVARPIDGAWRPTDGYDGRGALDLPGAAHMDIPLSWQPQTFTIACWYLRSLFNYSQGVRAAADWGAFCFYSDDDGRLCVDTDVDNRIILGNNALHTSSWRHYVFTFDKGVGTIYQNGLQLDRRTDMRLPTAWNGLTLGATGDAMYDELRVYSRARSPQEVSSLAAYIPYLPQNKSSVNTDQTGSWSAVSMARTTWWRRVSSSPMPWAGLRRCRPTTRLPGRHSRPSSSAIPGDNPCRAPDPGSAH